MITEMSFAEELHSTPTPKEPEEYGPVHTSPPQARFSFYAYTFVVGLVFIILVFTIAWAANRYMRAIAEDVKVIRNDLANIPPLSFNEKWAADLGELITQARALNESLKTATHTVDAMSVKVGGLDYSVNGLENAVGGFESQLGQARSVPMFLPPPKPKPARIKPIAVKVPAPLLPGQRNGPNYPIPR